jgi:hypothetical protein
MTPSFLMNLFLKVFLAKHLAKFQKIVLTVKRKIITINDPEFMKKFISPISYYSNVGLNGLVSLNVKSAA